MGYFAVIFLVDLNLGIDKIGVIYYNTGVYSILELLELKKNNWSTECAEIWQGFTICEVLQKKM